MVIDAIFHYSGMFAVTLQQFGPYRKGPMSAMERANFNGSNYPKFLAAFERFLDESGSGFIAGSKLSVADFAAYNVLAKSVAMDLEWTRHSGRQA